MSVGQCCILRFSYLVYSVFSVHMRKAFSDSPLALYGQWLCRFSTNCFDGNKCGDNLNRPKCVTIPEMKMNVIYNQCLADLSQLQLT